MRQISSQAVSGTVWPCSELKKMGFQDSPTIHCNEWVCLVPINPTVRNVSDSVPSSLHHARNCVSRIGLIRFSAFAEHIQLVVRRKEGKKNSCKIGQFPLLQEHSLRRRCRPRNMSKYLMNPRTSDPCDIISCPICFGGIEKCQCPEVPASTINLGTPSRIVCAENISHLWIFVRFACPMKNPRQSATRHC